MLVLSCPIGCGSDSFLSILSPTPFGKHRELGHSLCERRQWIRSPVSLVKTAATGLLFSMPASYGAEIPREGGLRYIEFLTR